jgi:SPP1 gp7 family putative phage head morphogenesis protein
LRGLAVDRAPSFAKSAYKRSVRSERAYARQLRKIARHIDDLLGGFDFTQPLSVEYLKRMLAQYAVALEPWAYASAERMIKEVAARDDQGWREVSAKIGRALKQEIDTAPTGTAMRQLLADQVALIKSLPTEAAERVQRLAQEGLLVGQRPETLSKRIMETGDVTKSRANLIARTETARVGSVLTQVRAQSIGCTHFIWRTTGDRDVRPSHRALNGKAFRYDDPPVCDAPDIRALPGQIWNCRCVQEPIVD